MSVWYQIRLNFFVHSVESYIRLVWKLVDIAYVINACLEDEPRRIYRRIQTAFLDFMLDVLYPIHNKAKTRLEAVKVKHVLKLFSSLKLPTDACRL